MGKVKPPALLKASPATIREYLMKVYTTPGTAGSFGGAENLYRAVKEAGDYNLSRKQISEFLNTRDEYSLHRPVYKNLPTTKVLVGGPNDLVQIDLVDMGRGSAKKNDGVAFLLTVIDCFSRMAAVIPLTDKSASSVLTALEEVYDNRDTPTTITADAGKEFTNKPVQAWLEKNNIQFNVAHGTHKAQFVERFNRTLKTLLSRYMTLHNTHKYIDVLDRVVRGYNTRYHSATGYRPVDVNDKNAKSIFNHLYGAPSEWFRDLAPAKF